LLRSLVSYYANISKEETGKVLCDILATPVSPELLPSQDGEISQCTEGIVGPYELHDFFLYYMLRYGFSPRKIKRLALAAFDGEYDGKTVDAWLRVFIRRFVTQQFTRSALPDGVKLGAVSLSPRGAFKMPSDAYCNFLLSELDGEF
jgi:NAD+ synthase (glutamine-hydrolysing)